MAGASCRLDPCAGTSAAQLLVLLPVVLVTLGPGAA